MKQFIINSVEAFGGRGSGITSFAQALISAFSMLPDAKLDLLLSVDNSASNPLAGSNLLKRYAPLRRSEKMLTAIRVATSSLVLPPGLGQVQKVMQISHQNTLYNPLCDQVFTQIASRYLPGNDLQHSSSSRGFLYGSNIFANALALFKAKKRPLYIRTPLNKQTASHRTVFHNPLPYPILARDCLNVVTVHDLIPITHPAICLDNAGYFYDLVSVCLRESAAIHCISNYTAQIISTYFGESARSKIFVAHQPIPLAHLSAQFKVDSAAALEARFEKPGAQGHQFILQVGSIEPKKNHRVTIDAFRIVRMHYPHLRLVVIGRAGWLSDDLCNFLSSAKDEGIEWQSNADYRTLIRHLKHASAVVFPSIVEGWGLPPLEAMSFGAPVVVSPIEACREACGNGALYMDNPWDAVSLAKQLIELLSSRDRAAKMNSLGFVQAEKYSLLQFQASLLTGYDKTVG